MTDKDAVKRVSRMLDLAKAKHRELPTESRGPSRALGSSAADVEALTKVLALARKVK